MKMFISWNSCDFAICRVFFLCAVFGIEIWNFLISCPRHTSGLEKSLNLRTPSWEHKNLGVVDLRILKNITKFRATNFNPR